MKKNTKLDKQQAANLLQTPNLADFIRASLPEPEKKTYPIKFKVGDVVYLNSDMTQERLMTVTDSSSVTNPNVYVTYLDLHSIDNFKSTSINQDALTLYFRLNASVPVKTPGITSGEQITIDTTGLTLEQVKALLKVPNLADFFSAKPTTDNK